MVDGDADLDTVLVVGESPTGADDKSGRPFVSETGALVRRLLRAHWGGPAVLDYAMKCTVLRSTTPKEEKRAEERCVPYLKTTFEEAAPDRVIVLGHIALRSIFGRYIPTYDARRGYSWLRHSSGKLVPVFYVQQPHMAAKNRFFAKAVEEDFAWALNADTSALMPPPYDGKLYIVETPEDAEQAAAVLESCDDVTYDAETAGKVFAKEFTVAAMGFNPVGTDDAYVWGRTALASAAARAPMLRVLEAKHIAKHGHNEKYDRNTALSGLGVVVGGFASDTQLWRHLELPGCDATLEVCSELVGMGGYKQAFGQLLIKARAQITHARKTANKGRQALLPGLELDPILVAAVENAHDDKDVYAYGLIRSPHLELYNGRDVVCTGRLVQMQRPLRAGKKMPNLKYTWKKLMGGSTEAVAQMEAWGVRVDRQAIGNFRTYLAGQLVEMDKRFERYHASPTSPDQMAALLFDKLGFKHPEKGSRSTDKDSLKNLRKVYDHPVLNDLLEHRRLTKMHDQYGPLDKFIRADGRLHPEFKIDGAETGRLSCVNPPLHQIPKGEDDEGNTEGKMIKNCFISGPGRVLLQLDFSQLELRIAALLSGDPVMTAMFKADRDFHQQTAELISQMYWGIPPEKVTKAHRAAVKPFNFGLLYGMTDKGLSVRMGCSVADAGRLRAAILGKWARLAVWMTETLNDTRRTGYTYTSWEGQRARQRYLPYIGNTGDDNVSRGLRVNADNGSTNTPVQGTASDYGLLSVIRTVDYIKRSGVDAKLCLSVHDSLILDVAEDVHEAVAAEVHGIMVSHWAGDVPIKVDVESGNAWGALEKLSMKKAA
jgi:uracil-DNA glycosylase family 4